MSVFFKRIIFLIVVSVAVMACGGETSTSKSTCKSDKDCSTNEECRFDNKTSTLGECVTRVKCQENEDCDSQRACNITLEGEDKYCGGYLIDFSFDTESQLKSGRVNDIYNETVELNGKTGAFFISVEGSLPDGLVLTPETGDISGTPTLKGEFTFKLIAYNGLINSKYYFNIIKVEKDFTISISEANVCTPKTCSSLNRVCGSLDDGCGTTLNCGTCEEGTCNASGQCEVACVPDCSGGKICGDDGCGGNTCGSCNAGETCSTDQTICEAGCIPQTCNDLNRVCGSVDDGCGVSLDCGTCAEGTCNASGQCEVACVPDCSGGKICGDDGCGGNTCGSCNADETCSTDQLSCEANCVPKTCNDLSRVCGAADDGCGGSLDCGTCAEGTCNASGQCEVACVPDCIDKACGDDGCGDVCGFCANTGETCDTLDSSCQATSIAGNVVITELMPDPSIVTDSKGEWIELYNTTDAAIDLTGLKVIKGTTGPYSVNFINNEIAPHGYLVIARTIEAESMLPLVDATSSFSLTNDGTATTPVIYLKIELNGEILDSIYYDSSSTGKSLQVDPFLKDHDLNDYSISWCNGSTVISDTNDDKGTPGTENLECPSN